MAASIFQWLNQLSSQITTSSSLFLILLALPIIFILFSFSKSGSKKHKLPPSPTRLPLIGNLHQLGTLPHRSLANLSKKHGPLMLLRLGQVQALVISSAQLAKEVMKTHDTVFSSRPKTTAATILLYGCNDIGFAPYGEYWRQLRKVSVLELLSNKRVQQFQYAREEAIGDLVKVIRKACLEKSHVNLSKLMIGASNNIMSRCIFGQNFFEGGSWFGELARIFLSQLVAFSFGDYYPSLNFIDRLRGFNARLSRTFVEVDGFLDKLIEEQKRANREDGSKHFVDILLQLQKDSSLEFELTQDDIKAILVDMLIGGSDTTSTTMEWLMAELMRKPNVLAKLQEEVRRVVGKKARVDVSDLVKMDYLKCVIKETLRLHPPVPLLVPRETIAPVELGSYYVPAKTRVFVNAFAIQRDPEFWEKPEEFLPERFVANSVDFRGQDFQFIPFGGGRRGCSGVNLGISVAEYEIANLIYWFDWKLPSDGSELAETLDMTEVSGLTMHKKYHLHLIPVLYSH